MGGGGDRGLGGGGGEGQWAKNLLILGTFQEGGGEMSVIFPLLSNVFYVLNIASKKF